MVGPVGIGIQIVLYSLQVNKGVYSDLLLCMLLI